MRHILNITTKASETLSVARNSILFTALLAMTPAVFAGMLVASSSLLAAGALAVAYASVVLGERLD